MGENKKGKKKIIAISIVSLMIVIITVMVFKILNTQKLKLYNSTLELGTENYIEELTKQENVYILEFGKSKIPLEYQNDADLMLMDPRRITVRFRNSGSRYDPFNIIFMGLYQGLCNLDYEYHQIHIEEYLQESKIKSRVLKR